jgi:para-nitrobenzyl esterase
MNRRTILRLFLASAGAYGAPAFVRHAFADSSPVATLASGKVRGFTVANGIHVFKGVRYGADTSGRRFLPPITVSPLRALAIPTTRPFRSGRPTSWSGERR